MKKITLLLSIIFTISTFAQQQYHVGCIGFYNLENLFDTLNSGVEIDFSKTWGEEGFTQEVEFGENEAELPDFDLGDANFASLEGTEQYDSRDEDNLPEGSRQYTTDVYRDKLDRLAEVVSQVGTALTPDGLSLLGISEVESRKVLEDFVKHPLLKDRNYQIVHFNSLDFRGIDVAFLYNPKYFTLENARTLPVKMQQKDSLSMRFTRDILMVSGKYDGETVHVFVNHWPSRRGGEAATTKYRQAAAAVNKKIIDSLTAIDPNVKVLVMGDFNDDPVSPSVKDVLEAKAKKGQVKAGGLYNPWVDFYKKGIGTLSYRGAWNLFDQIIMSSGWLDEKQSGYRLHACEIYNERYLMNRFGQYKEGPLRSYGGARYLGGYSDHFPVYMYIVKAVN